MTKIEYETDHDLDLRIARFKGYRDTAVRYSDEHGSRSLVEGVVEMLGLIEYAPSWWMVTKCLRPNGISFCAQSYLVELAKMTPGCHCSDGADLCSNCLFWLATAPARERCIAICKVLDAMEGE